jgi:hypothetical protein
VEQNLIPQAVRFVESYVRQNFSTLPPADLLGVAKNIAVNLILADDEAVRIAQARGQSSLTIAGDTVTFDTSVGRNPFLSPADEAILVEALAESDPGIHTDKSYVRADGGDYDAAGRPRRGNRSEYSNADLPPGWRRPWGSTGQGI